VGELADALEVGDVAVEFRKLAVVVIPDVHERRAAEIVRRQEEHRLEAQLVLLLGPVGFRIHRRACHRRQFRPATGVAETRRTVGPHRVGRDRVERGIVTAPAQRLRCRQLNALLGIGERIAADPGLTVGCIHDVALLVELGLARVLERRLLVLPGRQAHDVGRALDHLELATLLDDLLVRDRLHQRFDVLDVRGGDVVACLDLAFGVTLDGQELIGIGLADFPGRRDRLGQRSKDACRENAAAGICKEFSAGVVAAEAGDDHLCFSFLTDKKTVNSLPERLRRAPSGYSSRPKKRPPGCTPRAS
jgi:hypothetical protein